MLLNTNADDDADDSDADDEDYVYRTENIFFHENCKNKKDPVSTMQKPGLNNFSSCLDWSTPVDVITMGHSRNIFPCIRPFSAW